MVLEKREIVLAFVIGVLFLLAKFVQVQHKEYITEQKQCITSALFWEAGNQGELGMRAVATVIDNRLNSNKFKETTYCDIIKAKGQFSFVSHRPMDGYKDKLNPPYISYYETAEKIADDVINKRHTAIFSKDVLYYHADYVKPAWASAKKKVRVIGNHIFYKGGSK